MRWSNSAEACQPERGAHFCESHNSESTISLFSRSRVRDSVAIAAVIAGSLVAGALYAWFAGEDINWDWRNYHEYGALALLGGRFDVDVALGGFQTFLNPLAYLPAYLLRHAIGAPFWVGRPAPFRLPPRS